MEVFCENSGIYLGTSGPKNEDRENLEMYGLLGLIRAVECLCL